MTARVDTSTIYCPKCQRKCVSNQALAVHFAAKHPPLEKDIHRDIVIALRRVGCQVYNLAQGFRPGGKRHGSTRQTEGLPDLYVFPPAHSSATLHSIKPFWIEVKRPGGKQRDQQCLFQVRCVERNVPYVIGGLDAVLLHLRTIGVISGETAHAR